jgi:hypothetical protein
MMGKRKLKRPKRPEELGYSGNSRVGAALESIFGEKPELLPAAKQRKREYPPGTLLLNHLTGKLEEVKVESDPVPRKLRIVKRGPKPADEE